MNLQLPNILKSRLFQKFTWGVKTSNTDVTLTIDNTARTFDYETALQMSQELRVAAKLAKQNAGDFSRTFRICGRMQDAVAAHNSNANLKEI